MLGIVMLAHGYGGGLPERAAPLATMTNVGYLFRRSRRAIRRDRKRAAHS